MQKKQNGTMKGIMSIEEYIKKRKEVREEEESRNVYKEEKSPAWMLAELYG